MWKIIRQIARTGIRSEAPPASCRLAAGRGRAHPARACSPSSAGRWRSARSTPDRATAASWRSTRSTTRTTTSRASGSASSPARGTPTCCSSPARSRATWSSRWCAPTTRRRPPSWSSRSATAAATAASSARATRRCGGVGERPRGGRRRAGLPARADRDPARHPHGGAPFSAGRGGVLGRPVLKPVIADRRRLGRHGLRYPRRRERGHAWDISTN